MKQKKRTKKPFHIPYLIVCSLILCFVSQGQVFAEKTSVIRLRYGSYAPKGAIDGAAMWLFDEVSKRSGVEIKLETYFSGTLAKAPDALSAISSGVYDVGWISPAYTPGKLPYSMMMGSTPLVAKSLFGALAAADEVVRTFIPAQAEFKRSKVKFLFHTGVPHYNYIGIKPINSLDDIKGNRTRTYGYFSKAWAAFGGIPVAVSISEAYDGLQKGVFDGVLSQARTVDHHYHLTEVANYYTILDFGCLPAPVIMNLKTWNRLPAAVKKAMMEAVYETPRKGFEMIGSIEKEAIVIMKKKGVIFSSLPAMDRTRITKLSSTLSDQIVDDLTKRGVKDTRKAMDHYLKALDKYSAQE